MKIVVLDGHTLNPGDLSWADLATLGEFSVYDRTPDALVAARSAGAEILLTNKTLITAETISQLPELKYIGVLATGYNVVDLGAAAAKNVVVTNVPTYGTASVAQMTIAMILTLCHRVRAHSDAVHAGQWTRSVDFCFWNYPLTELAGKTIGIIGFGRIGRRVGKIAAAMGMHVLAADKVKIDEPECDHFQWASVPDVLSRSDVVTLHCPLHADTEGLINRNTLAMMKPSAFLINTSRGPLVVERDLADALNDDRLAGAAVDVLSTEPPSPDNPLLKAKNCLITPHIAWATRQARTRLLDTAVANVRAFLADRPVNVVHG